MMKHIYNNSRSPSVRGSDISLTSSSSSSLSADERLRGDMDHDQHHQLARHVWDRYTSSSELGKRNAPGDGDKKPCKLSEEESKKKGLTAAAAAGYNAFQCGQFVKST